MVADRLEWLIRPFAHRGLHAPESRLVENTESAFQAAIDAGYGIELDVRISGDGEVVVFHDDTLERLTLGSGSVASLSVRELKAAAFRNSADRIQTLPELLEQVAARVSLLIELKTDWVTHGALEQRTAAILRGYKGQAAVMSFDPYSVAAFARAAPQVTRGLVAETFNGPHDPATLSRWQKFKMRHLLSAFIARPHFVHYDIGALPSFAPWVWRSVLGRPLLTWTVRSAEQARQSRRWADAIVFEGFRP